MDESGIEQRRHQMPEHAGCVPRIGHGWREQTAIRIARAHRHVVARLHDGHAMAALHQFISRRQANQPRLRRQRFWSGLHS